MLIILIYYGNMPRPIIIAFPDGCVVIVRDTETGVDKQTQFWIIKSDGKIECFVNSPIKNMLVSYIGQRKDFK